MFFSFPNGMVVPFGPFREAFIKKYWKKSVKYLGTSNFNPKFLDQNDSKWPEKDFKHNLKKCTILLVGTPNSHKEKF